MHGLGQRQGAHPTEGREFQRLTHLRVVCALAPHRQDQRTNASFPRRIEPDDQREHPELQIARVRDRFKRLVEAHPDEVR